MNNAARKSPRAGLRDAWLVVKEGWQQLYQQASGALTRFRRDSDAEEDSTIPIRRPRWGLLPAEVLDEDRNMVVHIEIPGMATDELDVQVVGDQLVVRGEKHAAREQHEGRYTITERAYGRFERVVPLPQGVDGAKAKAEYHNGVLTIRLPKSQPRERKRIPIAGR